MLRSKALAQASATLVQASALVGLPQAVVATGVAALDAMLQGGYYAGELVEIIGAASAGKTQACLAAAAAAALQGRAVHYIDTNASFSARRVLQLAGLPDYSAQDAGQRQQSKALLSNICVEPAFDIYELLRALGCLSKRLQAKEAAADLLIVDSIASLAFPALSTSHDQGHALLSAAGRALLQLAHAHSLACLVTNYAVFSRDQQGQAKAALGNSWVGMPSTRLLLQKAADNHAEGLYVAEVAKSTRLPTGVYTTFAI